MTFALAEALILGFASGPVCLASCGPVLLPCLAVQPAGWRGNVRSLSAFLSGRLIGYLAFATAIWAVGMALPLAPAPRALIFGLANLALAVALLAYAWLPRNSCHAAPLVQIAGTPAVRHSATFTIGVLTGLNLCPPFAATAVRAVESGSLASSLLFFTLFFVGTAVWFLLTLAIGALRRIPAAPTVARFTLAALALYYGYLAIVTLSWRFFHA